ncbi:peroxiredoxin [Sphingomonas sp. Leaf67]|uniref:peroxiredoxin n=1 Tax=unclassified Sphingomonas TaxID=196159 RepID=UPI0006F8888B|nr:MULTISPECIES: peroxiredoxin [unclassified Sphingomonas]KQN81291.1 peroxiredoxin [Sphingomonas sp. Leaf62]KQN86799.1 peroxiredoxin [Sphingomonas sp. Leaf67]
MRIALLAAALTLPFAAPLSAALAPGAKAPDFTTRAAIAGKAFTLNLRSQLRKGPVVLYFFPAAFTGGCNAEAKAFADSVDQFKAAGATVIGMSADPIDKLQAFSNEHCAGRFAVASAGPRVIQGFDVALNRPAAADGKARTMTTRTSYVIGRDGRIAFVHSDMNPADHVRTTLAAVRGLAAPR